MLRGSIGSPKATRRPRAIVDFGGKILNWAFGVATDERLTELDRLLDSVRAETDRLTHLARHQATSVNETLWEVRATAHALSDLEASYTSLKGAINRLEVEKNHSAKEFERRVSLQTAIDTACAVVDEM